MQKQIHALSDYLDPKSFEKTKVSINAIEISDRIKQELEPSSLIHKGLTKIKGLFDLSLFIKGFDDAALKEGIISLLENRQESLDFDRLALCLDRLNNTKDQNSNLLDFVNELIEKVESDGDQELLSQLKSYQKKLA